MMVHKLVFAGDNCVGVTGDNIQVLLAEFVFLRFTLLYQLDILAEVDLQNWALH